MCILFQIWSIQIVLAHLPAQLNPPHHHHTLNITSHPLEPKALVTHRHENQQWDHLDHFHLQVKSTRVHVYISVLIDI